jgi:hypothetical protein
LEIFSLCENVQLFPGITKQRGHGKGVVAWARVRATGRFGCKSRFGYISADSPVSTQAANTKKRAANFITILGSMVQQIQTKKRLNKNYMCKQPTRPKFSKTNSDHVTTHNE